MAEKSLWQEIESGSLAEKNREAQEIVRKALERYGPPQMSLEELRSELGKQLKGINVSELLIEERA